MMPQAAQIKACCAAAYSSDLVALLLGDSYHPGGLALTRRLADLRPGQLVLDVASGPGTTARLFATGYNVEVIGVELSPANVERATASAADLPGVSFQVGDAERLPLPDASLDAIVCECAFCTFPDKPTAAAELARVLRQGGRLGITDVTADITRLPADSPPPRRRWPTEHRLITDFIETRCVSDRHQGYVRTAGSEEVDASLLLGLFHGYTGPGQPRLRGTIDAVRRDLADGPFVHRYRGPDGLPDGEGAFLWQSPETVETSIL